MGKQNDIALAFYRACKHQGEGGQSTADDLDVAGQILSPPYVGPSGWVGVWLDGDVAWDDLLEILRDGYRMTAPRKLLAQMEDD